MDVSSQRSPLLQALLAAILVLLCSCAPASQHGASRYFEGKALELAIASERGDAKEIARLMKDEGVNPDKIFSRKEGVPLIAWPLRAENLDGLRAMLENGADPNARMVKKIEGKDFRFNNAMVYAAKMEDPRYLKLLLQHGGDGSTRNSNNQILLFQAFMAGNKWQNVKALVENGAKVNEENYAGGGDSILSLYTGRGGFEQAYWLLQHGADPTLPTEDLVNPEAPPRTQMIEDIYWEITTPDNLPWQKKCQQWLADRNIPRPPMPEHIRKKREAFKFPSREEDIPLL
ncbi:MAG TPA: hypothetical protein DEA38_02080 [Stenotrophomonas sp.]|nr:hypothetical protein [Stenotrophomonas sp.]